MSAHRKICFLIRSLDLGGAETQLSLLARNLDRKRFRATVVCFYGGGPLEQGLLDAGIEVVNLEKGGRWDTFGFFGRLITTLRHLRPDILHCYLGPSNLFGLAAGVFVAGCNTIWSIRASFVDLKRYDYSWRLSFFLERVLSRFPKMIIANSQAGRTYYVEKGFPAARTIVIENGIDIERMRSFTTAGGTLRDQWGVPKTDTFIGLVTRIDPMKDHPTFFRAAAILAVEYPDVRFVCVGKGEAGYVGEMKALASSLGLADKVIWAGASDNMPAVYAALRIGTSSSAFGEGFSNVLGEAMASGIPCVTTNVGDSAAIVGAFGVVVDSGDAEAMAAGWQKLLALDQVEYEELAQQCRARIADNFSVARMTEKTAEVYLKVLS